MIDAAIASMASSISHSRIWSHSRSFLLFTFGLPRIKAPAVNTLKTHTVSHPSGRSKVGSHSEQALVK